MRIAVLGVGLIGGSIGLAAKRRGGTEVVGFDPEGANLERGLEIGALDSAAESIPGAAGPAELVFCAAPVSALPGLVVHGAVRVQAALASRAHIFTAQQLVPHDLQVWRGLRAQVSFRQESRAKQSRFRRDPAAYLAALEAQLLKVSLRS